MSHPYEQERSQQTDLGMSGIAASQAGQLQLAQPSPVSGIQANALNLNLNQGQSGLLSPCWADTDGIL